MVRYPLGGMLSWALQWPLGLQRLGHDVYILENANYADACFDLRTGQLSDDCEYGLLTVKNLLRRFELDNRLIFLDSAGAVYGAASCELDEIFKTADLIIDTGNHGAWQERAHGAGISTVLVDGEPGFTQMKMENLAREGGNPLQFDFYFSNGANVGTADFSGPTAGRTWHHVWNPIVTDCFRPTERQASAPFTTVMNWQSHDAIDFNGRSYGQKDVEFEKFVDLPKHVDIKMEVAAAGRVPNERLRAAGWHVKDAHAVTGSFDSYWEYIRSSSGEFSVCKNVFVASHSGWFSDRSAAYLASGRPVVLQDTGFSKHLPCGRGLFAVNTLDEAIAALREVEGDYESHSASARELACEYLDSGRVLTKFLNQLGL